MVLRLEHYPSEFQNRLVRTTETVTGRGLCTYPAGTILRAIRYDNHTGYVKCKFLLFDFLANPDKSFSVSPDFLEVLVG